MGWLCSYTPLELIYAAGFLPYRIEGHSKPIENADSYTHTNMCQFVRSTIDVAVEGGYDFLEGVIFVNSCDAMRRLYDVWKKFIPTKFSYMFDLPMGNSSLGQKYLKTEFQKLKTAIEKHTSNIISNESIEKSIDIYNESRKLFHKLNSPRVQNPPLISGKDIMNVSLDFYKLNPEIWNDNIQGLIEKKQKAPPSELSNKKPRILLSGSPIHDVEFISFIEECNLNVVYEDICTGSKFFDIKMVKSNDLLDALSEAYLNRSPCARMMKIEERVKILTQISEKFDINGIIHHSLKFCDTYLYDVPKLKEILNDQGLNVLFIESDGRLGSLNQLKTRIEAFSEMIRN